MTGCAQEKFVPEKIFPKPSTACAATAIENRFLIHKKDGTIFLKSAENREAFIKKYLNNHNIVEIDFVENDQRIKIEPAFYESTSPGSWGYEKIEADLVWQKGIYGNGVTVAVIDSGLDTTHTQLANQLWTSTNEIPDNGVDDDQNGFTDDIHGWDFIQQTGQLSDPLGHGTHVAGIIAAEHNQSTIKGIAPQAKILPLRFLDESGSGNVSEAIAAIEYANKMGAQIINASWGAKICSTTLMRVIASLSEKGVLFITAAGNNHQDIDTYPEYPASYEFSNQITVGASNDSDQLAIFSNTGIKRVHLLAPGSNILSTFKNNSSAVKSGTSMAAPFVAGASALLWSYSAEQIKNPVKNVNLIKQALLESVDVSDYPVATSGRINVSKALNRYIELLALYHN